MKKLFRPTLIGILIAAIAGVGVTAPANADSEGSGILPNGFCSASSIADETCIAYAVSPGEDPLTNAVAQLVLTGEVEQAEKFIEIRRTVSNDDTQPKLERIVHDPSSARAGIRGGGHSDGSVYGGIFWELFEFVDYGYCDVYGCGPTVGQLLFILNQSIVDFPQVTVDGSYGVAYGPNINATGFTCKTFYEVFPFDQVIRDWQACRNINNHGYAQTRTINTENWNQGSAPGTTHHLEVTAQFRVQGDPGNKTLTVFWNSHSYKIQSPSSNTRFI